VSAANARGRPRAPQRAAILLAFTFIVATVTVASAAANAAVQFRDGWMRPADAGDPTAEAYVDVEADAAVTIVAVRTGIAERVELVAPPAPSRPAGATWRIAPGQTLRFARKGNVLKLHRVTRTAATGDTVEVTFTFEDAAGRRFDARAPIVVRGVRPPAPH
jgi:copper(I)-binding protein